MISFPSSFSSFTLRMNTGEITHARVQLLANGYEEKNGVMTYVWDTPEDILMKYKCSTFNLSTRLENARCRLYTVTFVLSQLCKKASEQSKPKLLKLVRSADDFNTQLRSLRTLPVRNRNKLIAFFSQPEILILEETELTRRTALFIAEETVAVNCQREKVEELLSKMRVLRGEMETV